MSDERWANHHQMAVQGEWDRDIDRLKDSIGGIIDNDFYDVPPEVAKELRHTIQTYRRVRNEYLHSHFGKIL